MTTVALSGAAADVVTATNLVATAATYNGSVLEVFPFWPNYRSNFIERWEWKTDVLQSYDATEQRVMLRAHARRYFEFEVFARSVDRAALEQALWYGQSNVLAIPCWNEGIQLSATTLQNPTTNFVPIPTARFSVGGYAIGFTSPTKYSIYQIAAISSDGLRFLATVDWDAFTTVYPALIGTLNQQQPITRVTGDFTYGTITFNGFATPSPYENTLLSYPLYLGYPVVEEVFDWSQNSTTTFEYKTQVLDNQLSAPFIDVESLTTAMTQTTQWFLKSRPLIDNFLKFIHHCYGRLTPFWISSGAVDMIPISVVSNTLVCFDSGYTTLVVDKTSRCHIRIQLRSGAITYAKILTSTLNTDGTETMVLDQILTFTASSILLVSFLNLARLEADRLELAFKGPTFATAAVTVRTLKNEL